MDCHCRSRSTDHSTARWRFAAETSRDLSTLLQMHLPALVQLWASVADAGSVVPELAKRSHSDNLLLPDTGDPGYIHHRVADDPSPVPRRFPPALLSSSDSFPPNISQCTARSHLSPERHTRPDQNIPHCQGISISIMNA